MTIITLVGSPDSGKTSSIKMLANEMLKMQQQTGQPVLMDDYCKRRQRSCIDRSKLKDCGGDLLKYRGDITIKFTWNGKTVGITSFGDDVRSIASKYDIFKDCDIFISAAHSKDNTIRYIDKLAKNNTYIKINKSTVKALNISQDTSIRDIELIVNTETAKEMLNIIEKSV